VRLVFSERLKCRFTYKQESGNKPPEAMELKITAFYVVLLTLISSYESLSAMKGFFLPKELSLQS